MFVANRRTAYSPATPDRPPKQLRREPTADIVPATPSLPSPPWQSAPVRATAQFLPAAVPTPQDDSRRHAPPAVPERLLPASVAAVPARTEPSVPAPKPVPPVAANSDDRRSCSISFPHLWIHRASFGEAPPPLQRLIPPQETGVGPDSRPSSSLSNSWPNGRTPARTTLSPAFWIVNLRRPSKLRFTQ